MWRALRKTLRRGWSEVPLIFRRMRSFLRSRPTICMAMLLASARLRGLAGLLADLLALVPHALAAVGLGWAEAADLRGRLPHALLVGAREDDDRALGVARDLALDALGERERDGVREAEAQ